MNMKVLIGVNVLTQIESGPYGNHCKFWYQIGKKFPDYQFISMTPPRMSIDRMRNECARLALYNECNYLMFLDDDVIIPDFCFENLIKHFEAPGCRLVAGLVHIRSYPFKPMIFKKYRNEKNQVILRTFDEYESFVDKESGLVRCDAVGFSCCIIDCRILKNLRPPYFVTGTYNTEDVYFCCKIQDNLPEVDILCDTNIKCGHLGDKNIIHPDNVERMREIEKSYYPDGVLDNLNQGRDEKYIEEAVDRIGKGI